MLGIMPLVSNSHKRLMGTAYLWFWYFRTRAVLAALTSRVVRPMSSRSRRRSEPGLFILNRPALLEMMESLHSGGISKANILNIGEAATREALTRESVFS